MEFLKNQILLLLSLAVLLPSGARFAHVFSKHDHKVCIDHGDGHYHEKNLDCEFFQFRNTHNFLSKNEAFTVLVFSEIQAPYHSLYNFLPQQEPLPYSLRGPPSYSIS